MQVENVTGISLSARGAPDKKRKRSVCHRMLRKVIVNYKNVAALFHKVFAHSTARIGSYILKGRGVCRGSGNYYGIIHSAVLVKSVNNTRYGRLLLTYSYVNADNVLALLVYDSIGSDNGLTRLSVTDDKLTLTSSDGDHGIYSLDTGLKGHGNRFSFYYTVGAAFNGAVFCRRDGSLAVNGITERIHKVADVLRYMGGNVKVVETLMDARWSKLVINSCGSGMSAACGSPFGPVIDNERGLECMSMLGYEVAMCAKAAGCNVGESYSALLLKPEESRKFFYSVYINQYEGKASMLQDLEAGRITEVGMINGYVCETGDKYGIDTPYNDALVSIVRRMEKGELPLSMDNLKYFPDIKY